ncbi:sensor histidine kinase, partial [Novosphingobium sp. B 225]|uniref:sensor histidine kinase n=1 Tax=Novosphingobium sp. B 225 TaxID=1961849 RepID=UPI001124CE70
TPAAAPAPVEVLPPAPTAAGEDSIGALVKRIEAYRKARQVVDAQPLADSPRLPLGEEHALQVPPEARAFDFATDAAGRIIWADPGVAPMTMGIQLDREGLAPPALREALRRRQPLRALHLKLSGARAIAGQWQIDAAPAFDPLTGRFTGYRGRMRRPAPAAAAAVSPLPPRDSEADRLRQMLHELRTPVNAIQGFAEVIQQQLFGPTPHEYRALAAGIAGDAARMLAAFEELERLAKLDSGALDPEPGETDLAALIAATVAQLAAHTRSRGSGFAAKIEEPVLPVPLARIEVERLVWRLLATLAGTAAPGEELKLKLRSKDGAARLTVQLPAALARLDDKALFAAATGAVPQVIAAGVFGVGFALRLARAEARAAGGNLERRDDRLRLELPGLTAAPSDHSHRPNSDTA